MHIGAVAGSGGVPTETGGRPPPPPRINVHAAAWGSPSPDTWLCTLTHLTPLSCLCLNSVAFKRLNQSTHRRSQLWALRIPSFDSHRNTPVQVSSSERIHKKTWQHELTVQAVKETEQIKDGNVCPYRSSKKKPSFFNICLDMSFQTSWIIFCQVFTVYVSAQTTFKAPLISSVLTQIPFARSIATLCFSTCFITTLHVISTLTSSARSRDPRSLSSPFPWRWSESRIKKKPLGEKKRKVIDSWDSSQVSSVKSVNKTF